MELMEQHKPYYLYICALRMQKCRRTNQTRLLMSLSTVIGLVCWPFPARAISRFSLKLFLGFLLPRLSFNIKMIIFLIVIFPFWRISGLAWLAKKHWKVNEDPCLLALALLNKATINEVLGQDCMRSGLSILDLMKVMILSCSQFPLSWRDGEPGFRSLWWTQHVCN